MVIALLSETSAAGRSTSDISAYTTRSAASVLDSPSRTSAGSMAMPRPASAAQYPSNRSIVEEIPAIPRTTATRR